MSEYTTTQQFKDDIIAALRYSRGVTPKEANVDDMYVAASTAVRNRLVDKWVKTREDTLAGSTKAVGYLSAEFLLGTQLPNAILNAGLTHEFDEAVTELGFDPREVEDAEYEPGLGNGGLGRLAACFIDSLATLAVPAIGYGIRYEYGIFRQEFGADGSQIEKPDYWLENGNPWGQADYRRSQIVHFGGTVEVGVGGKKTWKPAWGVRALPYDYMVPGYGSGRVNTLRLWSAKALDEFDLATFNRSDYDGAVKAQTAAENISKVLYPEDSTLVGKQLRLEQQYFFAAASLADAISLFYPGQEHPDLTTLPDKITFQLNDTHPVIAIPELMRLMMDVYGYDWDTAWSVTQKTFNYTCHTLLPEALEVWPASLLGDLLPRHLEIITRISREAAADEAARGASPETVERMRVYTGAEDGGDVTSANSADAQVRMAYLATVGGSHVNGVAELHSDLLKESVLKDFADVYPQKFTNVTNGVTPRRFVRLANPRLSDLITEGLGTDTWLGDLDKLQGLEALASDDAFVDRYAAVKRANKADFAAWYQGTYGVSVDPNSMFNTMIKRLHEYKRQSMKILQVIATYADIKAGRIDVTAPDFVPRTVIFGAKSAPGYALAKETIKLINNVARVIDADPAVQGKLRVIFPYNYNVTVAQHIIPATDLDEQISLAGKEASGTSNMKFALNGALTVGTLDGANVEIRNRVGAENFFLFGMDVDEVSALETAGYNPRKYYEEDAQLKGAIDMIASGAFSDGDRSVFSGFVNDLLNNDRFMALADFRAYMDVQGSIEAQYRDEHEWARKALLNTARSGYFSSDRSIRDYLDRVWMTQGLK
ncbi:MAG: glycogen/starch/alpha-glucan phosphorylase [Bifidobacteriaceae bacterium]|nr:glycogen/starch/alpha-glucan phosphorylase [Bifidobacteriaceae bacterium]